MDRDAAAFERSFPAWEPVAVGTPGHWRARRWTDGMIVPLGQPAGVRMSALRTLVAGVQAAEQSARYSQQRHVAG